MSLIRVLEIPPPSGKFHFGGGEPQTFIEVDWFRCEGPSSPDLSTDEGKETLRAFVRGKRYYRADQAYVLLHQQHTITMNYEAP